jgi:DNA-binding transcriptional LysR family regulator
LLAALALYAAWTVATWALEGRMRTLLRPEAAFDRALYAVVANLLIGTVGAAWVVRGMVSAGHADRRDAGFGPPARSALAVAAGLGLGFGLYAAPGYLERHSEPDFAAGCPGHRLVTGLDGTEVPQVASWLAEAAPRAAVALQTDSPEAQLQAALCGEGMACLSRLRGDASGAALLRLRPPLPQAVVEIWLAVHKDNRRTPRIRLVLDAVAAAVRDRAGALHPPEIPDPADPAA